MFENKKISANNKFLDIQEEINIFFNQFNFSKNFKKKEIITFENSLKNHFKDYKIKDWKSTFDVNITTPFFLSQLFSRQLIKSKKIGSIINVTSIGAELAFPNNPAYQASKAGLKHLTKSMAYDLAKYKIRVNNLVPGYTKDGMNKKSWFNPKTRAARSKRSLLNRWAEPDEISNGVLYLIGENSNFITGTDLVVDGGWTIKGF